MRIPEESIDFKQHSRSASNFVDDLKLKALQSPSKSRESVTTSLRKSLPRNSPEKITQDNHLNISYVLGHVRPIKVSPPKPGKLYPCLSDIEVTTENDSDEDDLSLNQSTGR